MTERRRAITLAEIQNCHHGYIRVELHPCMLSYAISKMVANKQMPVNRIELR